MPTTKALSASKFFGKDRYEYYLNELLTQQKVGGNVLSKSQVKEGFLKRKDKISFEKFVEKVISTKTAKSAIVQPEIKPNPVSGGVGLGSRGGELVKSSTGALEKYVSGVSKPQKMSGIGDDISKITKSVISIAEILSGQKKLKDSSTSYDRRKAEQEKRGLAESKLEKRFDGLKKAAEKILAPVKSLLDKIINFLVTVFLGRVVYKLLEWFGDPKNADKVRAISRFLGDHWPKLLALYLTFGTSVGRFALGLTKIVAKGAIKLLAQILLLSKAKKLSAAGRFLGGRGGNVVGAVLGTAAVVGGAYALTQGMKGDDEEPKTLKPEEPKIPGYVGGGIIKIPKFVGGGLNFKGMFGGALGSSPEKPQEMPNGFVSGEKGVDKVPAMLSDGEFVMSVGAVQKYGVDTLEGMNAAGGGTNEPKMMSGKTYAAGGGMMDSRSMDIPSSSPTTPKIPTLSPINLSSSSSSNVNAGSGNNAIDISANLIKKEEALSSLSLGKNDYIVPGGKSVVSGTDWSNIGPKTKIYAYPDSRGIPTIGWGATFYDGITSGTKSVKLGDSITKENADKTLANNIGILAKKYSKEIANWSKMSPQQQSAILSIGYNAGPNAPLGAYPKLSAAIKSGNMVEVANNVTRSGPSAERIANEKKLLLSGPKDLIKQTTVPSKATTPIAKNQPNMFQKFGSTISSIMSPPALAEQQPSASSKLNSSKIQPQNDLSYRQKQAKIAKTNPSIKSVSPPVKRDSGGYSAPIGVNGSNNGGRRSASVGSQTPSFSARNPSGGRSKQETLGLMR